MTRPPALQTKVKNWIGDPVFILTHTQFKAFQTQVSAGVPLHGKIISIPATNGKEQISVFVWNAPKAEEYQVTTAGEHVKLLLNESNFFIQIFVDNVKEVDIHNLNLGAFIADEEYPSVQAGVFTNGQSVLKGLD